jgi:hypothetical protein
VAGHVAGTEERTNAYKILVGKPEGKRPVVRPTRTREDNIRMDLTEIRWEGVDYASDVG